MNANHEKLLEMTVTLACAELQALGHGGTNPEHRVGAIFDALAALGNDAEPASGNVLPQAPSELKPAVSFEHSVTPDAIISLEDGREYSMLKRHLAKLGMTPDEYRTKWGLPADYPMVAPNYAAKRSEIAKQSGLGRKAA